MIMMTDKGYRSMKTTNFEQWKEQHGDRRDHGKTLHVAIVNLITQTSLLRHKAPVVLSNKEAMIVAFARALQKQDVRVDVFVSDAYKPGQKEEAGVPVIYLPTIWKQVFWPSCIPFTPRLLTHLQERYDAIVCSEVFQAATLLAVVSRLRSRKKIPVFIWQEMARHQRLGGQFLSKLYHSLIVKFFLDRHIARYIPRSELARRFLIEQGIASDKISDIIPHGIDFTKFYHDPSICKERYIFSPSRLVEAKGVDVLLKAFALVAREVQDVTLVIQGDGPGLPEYRQLAEELGCGEKVIFSTARVGHDEMRRKYQKAIVTVIASRRDNVIFSDMESMACGTPVIISDGADSHRNFMDHRGGAVFPREDHQSLARHILPFVNNRSFCEVMERDALARAALFNNDHLARQLKQEIEFYQKKPKDEPN